MERAYCSDQSPVGRKGVPEIFIKTLSSFYYERMISRAPNDFTKMVNMGMHLEEGVREGRLCKEEESTTKKYGGSFSKKKEGDTNSVFVGRKRRPYARKNSICQQHHHQISYVIQVFTNISVIQSATVQQ